jgi:hypothetical protein
LRESIGHYLDGLLSGLERKTGWLLAERAGEARPHRLQAVLGRGRWDAEAARDLVRAYALEALADRDAVLVVDETGFLKKGEHSVGVARQYSGTAGRIENCQVGVFLAYASRYGQALIDRRLFLPEAWASDQTRRGKAGVPEEVAFATKPAIAREMITSALDAGMPCAFVLADALYGSDKRLRVMLESREQPYVLAVRSNERLMTIEGGFATRDAPRSPRPCPRLPGAAWPPAKGPRDRGSTTGHGCASCACKSRPGTTGCWSAAACATPRTRPTTWCLRRWRPRSPNWPGWPACAGPSRRASAPPRKNLASTTARHAPGTAGTAT